MKILNRATAQATAEAVNAATTTLTDKVKAHFAAHRNTYLGVGGGIVIGAAATSRRDAGTSQSVRALKSGDVYQTINVYVEKPDNKTQ